MGPMWAVMIESERPKKIALDDIDKNFYFKKFLKDIYQGK